MATRYWIKLYHEVLHDPKMGRLPDRLWRRCIELFLLAGEHNDSGRLPEIGDIAWTLRADLSQLVDDLAALEEIGIITRDDNEIIVTKFAERQDPDTVQERQERYRNVSRKSNANVTKRDGTRNENVTTSVTDIDKDIDKDIDTDKEVEVEADTEVPAAGAVAIAYENEIGFITSGIADEIRDAEKTYPIPWILEAIHEAFVYNKRSWAYILAILKRWKAEGRGSKKSEKANGYINDDFPSELPAAWQVST